MRKFASLGVMAVCLACPVRADVVDYLVGPGGGLAYDGAGGPLVGTGIPVSNGTLDFTTGNYLNNNNGNGWNYDTGGNVTFTQNGQTAFLGTFTRPTTITFEGSTFNVLGGGFGGQLNGSAANGAFSMLFTSNAAPGDAITDAKLLSGNLGVLVPQNTPPPVVPEPSTSLMAAAVIGVAGAYRYLRYRKRV